MSLKTASDISDLYIELCSRESESKNYGFYKYSDIKNLDIIDILNAFKILIAHKIFKSNALDEVKRYTVLAEGLLYMFPIRFGPEEIAEKINLLDKSDNESITEFIKLKNSIPQNNEWNNSETLSSFLRYLLTLDKKDENFWEKVYEHIGISWDKKDIDDEINFIINHKKKFFEYNSLVKETKEIEISENKKNQNAFIYKKYKYLINRVLTCIFLGFSLFFPAIRILTFSIIAITSTLKIYFSVTKPIINRFLFLLFILEFFLYTATIFLPSLTLYAVGYTTISMLIEYARGLKKNTVEHS